MKHAIYTLPAYWASYLINGDSSGLEPKEKAECDAFLASQSLPRSSCAECSDESEFRRMNDANGMAGDVLEYTFHLWDK